MGMTPKYQTVEELEEKIIEYFETKKPQVLEDKDGRPVLDKYGHPIYKSLNHPTLSGIALHLGFCSRQSMYDYEKKSDEFSYTIKKARLRIEEVVEELALVEGKAGQIFILKNLGWTDKQEHEHSGEIARPTTLVIESGGKGKERAE
jgi:hypothetical protein